MPYRSKRVPSSSREVVLYKPKQVRRRKRKSASKVIAGMNEPFEIVGGHLGKRYLGSRRIGRHLGRFANVGAQLGAALISGKGDYTIKSIGAKPSNMDMSRMSSIMGKAIPSFAHGKRIVNVKQTEYLGAFSSSVAFTNTSYPINPGIYQTFPWLSSLASNFEEYRFNGLIFYYRSMSADALNSTNTALGKIIMCTEYNSLLSNFASDVQMENHEFAQSSKPSCDMVHAVECRIKSNPISELYVRSGGIPSNADLRMYDLGNFQIASYGSQAAAVVGELWVSYDIDLLKPQLVGSQQGGDILSSLYEIPVTGITTGSAYFGSSLPSSTSYVSGSLIPLTFTNTTITLPSYITTGVYILSLIYIGASTALTNALLISCTTNCSNHNFFYSGFSSNSQTAGATATVQFYERCFSVTGPSAVLTVSSGTLPGSLTNCTVWISQVNSNITA